MILLVMFSSMNVKGQMEIADFMKENSVDASELSKKNPVMVFEEEDPKKRGITEWRFKRFDWRFKRGDNPLSNYEIVLSMRPKQFKPTSSELVLKKFTIIRNPLKTAKNKNHYLIQ